MGFLSNLGNALNAEEIVLQNVASTLTLGLVPQAGNFSGNKLAVTVAENPLTSAALIAAPFSSGVKGLVGAAVKSLSPLTKLGLVVATPVVVGAVTQNPQGTATALIKVPSAEANVGKNFEKFVENPSVSTAENIFKENPVAATTATVLTLGAAGLVTSGAISNYLNYENTQAVKQNTKATLESISPTATLPSESSSTPTPKEPAVLGTLPSTAALPSKTPADVVSASPAKAITPGNKLVANKPSAKYKRKAYKAGRKESVRGNIRIEFSESTHR